MTPQRRLAATLLLITLGAAPLRAAPPAHGSVVTETLTSTILRENRIGLETRRAITAYLPPGYAGSGKHYPVVYFLHNAWWSPRQAFADGNLVRLIEQGFANGVVREFIFVVADYTGPTTGSLYENSPVSGRWLDYTVNEVVPFVDRRFRTLATRDSRAVVGDFFGGRGALKLAMVHAETFSVAYALHPVATGVGDIPWQKVEIDWPRIHAAQTYAELAGLGRTQVFWSIHQAFLPNLAQPPCYCDFFVEMRDGAPQQNSARIRRMQQAFLLDQTLDAAAPALRTLRGLAFDWGRFDTTQAHVISNRAFSRLLEDLGVAHEAEEFNGDPWNRTWTPDGRFATRVLPFLNRRLVFIAD